MQRIMLMTTILLSIGAVNVHADTTYFVDGILGYANQKNSLGGFDTISGSDSSKGLRGGFYLKPNFGVEFTYMDLGVAEDSFINGSSQQVTDMLDTNWTGVGFQGGIRLGHSTVLVGRIGLAAWQIDYAQTNSGFPGDAFRDSDEGVDAYLGVGLRFDIEDHVRVSLEYQTLDFEAALGSANSDQTLQNIGISIGVLF